MPLELFLIQWPTTPEGRARIPLLLVCDGSGFAFEYNGLLPLDRAVYGVSVAVPEFHKQETEVIRKEYGEYLAREFSTMDDYIDKFVRVIEEEVLVVREDDDGSSDEEDEAEDSDNVGRKERSRPKESVQRMSSLHIGGFSFGGMFVRQSLMISQAIELARRLISQPIRPVGSEASVQVDVASVILFDTYNPSATQCREAYKRALRTGEFDSEPGLNFAGLPEDHPMMIQVAVHIRHLTTLALGFHLQPLATNATGEGKIPPVHYVRTLDGTVEEVNSEERAAYWTKELLPTLDFEKMKMLEHTTHMAIWRPPRVAEVTEWLKDILDR
ncbi:hypothetical protein K439DRAFT_1658879 [Ramaria rubella]|nr:hypothetical protein K439DRAFT_1658879 [Ramaria rubella]